MDLRGKKFIRLNSETIILPFKCGDADLDGFLFEDAKNYSANLLAVTYLIQDDKNTLAYFNYLNDKISHFDLDGNESKFFSRIGRFLPTEKSGFKSYPAVKIGRFAVHSDCQGSGLGKYILDYTKNNFIENNKTGCKFITVDAYAKSVNFYKKNGFDFLSNRDRKSDTRLMYYNLEELS